MTERTPDRESVETPPPPASDHAGVVAWPPLIFLGSAGGGMLLHVLAPAGTIGSSVARPAGIVLALGAGAIAFWAERAMKAAGTNVRPDRPTTAIVTGGPYRFTRNPMYVSLCLLQVSLGLILRDAMTVLLTLPLAVVLHHGVVLREEAYLERKFGEDYLQWKRRTRRWI